MPFVNGKFYMNPTYGRALENARSSEAASNHEPQQQDSAAHWVTIDRHHVLIQNTQPGQASRNGQNQQAQQTIRDRIAEIAKKSNGSTDWAFTKRKDNFPPDTNKCNKYVYDVTNKAGAGATVIGSDRKLRPPLASEWADPNTKIANWRALGKDEKPQPGDVAAYKLPGGGTSFTGHSGIVTAVDQNGLVHAMAAHDNVVGPDDKFNSTSDRPVTYRRYKPGGR